MLKVFSSFLFINSVLIISFLSSISAEARLTDGKVQIMAAGDKILGKVDSGFHFNIEAPSSIASLDGKTEVKPLTKVKKEIVFDTGIIQASVDQNLIERSRSNKTSSEAFTRLVADKTAKFFKLSFYVCDDLLTVCEPHHHAYSFQNSRLSELSPDQESLLSGTPSAAASDLAQSIATVPKKDDSSATLRSAKGPRELKHGFWQNDFHWALDQAKRNKKLISKRPRKPSSGPWPYQKLSLSPINDKRAHWRI